MGSPFLFEAGRRKLVAIIPHPTDDGHTSETMHYRQSC